MLSECLTNNYHELIMGLLPAVLMIVEYWLGKTDKTKSASIIELIVNIIKTVLFDKLKKKE